MNNNKIIPLFSSDYSGRSILTISKEVEIKDNTPVSLLAIAQKHGLTPVWIIENNLTGFIKTQKYFSEKKIPFIFGLKIIVVPDLYKREPETLRDESKVIIFLKNSSGYEDLIKIYSLAATWGKYYKPRTDWNNLKKMWTPNLFLVVPFYDSFLHQNLLKGAQVVPDFVEPPIFFIENHQLPFDCLIQESVEKFCALNSFITLNTHSVYYYKKDDYDAYLTYRAILNRSTLAKPELDHFGSDMFSFESYLERAKNG